MKQHELTLDSRTQKELCGRVEELAASYTPEWRFDRENPDVGSTLALIFAGQMADNIRRINQLPEKYHTEFLNLLGLTLKSAYPASGVVVAELMQETVPGVTLPRGSRLVADREDGTPILFETTGDVYLTGSRLTDILSLSGTQGKILPILGGPEPAQLVPAPAEEEAEGLGEEPERPVPVVSLFDYQEQGIQRNALLLYHRSVFGGENAAILLQIGSPEGKSLASALTDDRYWRWSYYDGSGLHPFDKVEVRDNAVFLYREGQSQPFAVDGTDYHMICLEALEPIQGALTVGELRVASLREAAPPEVILRDGEALEAEACMPFGDTVSLFDECYICDDLIFSQQDAQVTLSFRLSSKKKMVHLTAQQVHDELKIIKRKPKAVQYEVAYTAPERVALEYYNGQGWRHLPCSNQWSALFDGTHPGEYQITFQCPADWASVPVNGYEGRCLRLRVTQADDCYLLPCEHTMPVLRDVSLSYSYAQPWRYPQRVETVRGTLRDDRTKALLEGAGLTAFAPLPYPAASLYLGFRRPLEGAPVSILFDVEGNVHFSMEPIAFEYSTRHGFKEMKVVDGTHRFSRAGTVLFMPPSDFAPLEVEGIRRWWLRIRGSESQDGYHAQIRRILLNAVDVCNQQTQPEEEFYVEVTTPNMVFPLAARNILRADVFVSEFGQLSRHQMRQMLEQSPQDVRVEYDFLGEITSFFVRWTEVESFDSSKSGDRHYMLDRMRSTLIFGDGVHVRIPQAQAGTAILVQAVSCDGSAGNVSAGAINRFFGNVLYVQSVYNPTATYAGSDLEDLEGAHRRGADLLSGRGRLISERDFTRAVRAFSKTVKKVKCLAGQDLEGKPDHRLVTIAVMTEDYDRGSGAFRNIQYALRQSLLERCEATLAPDCLILSEPVYVEISVTAWVKAKSTAGTFEIQDLILERIRAFLDPMERPGHSGWEIGALPTEGQLRMLLQSLRFEGYVERVIAVARYVDRRGVHESTLDQLSHMPFAIGINGQHQVYIQF